MKTGRRFILAFIVVMLLIIASPAVIYANSAEPPRFTIIVQNPPEDLTLSLQLINGNQSETIELSKEQQAWEAYYSFYYRMLSNRNYDYSDAVLIAESSSLSFECPLPDETYEMYNNLLTLDLNSKTLKAGQPPFRVPILVSLRVALTLIIEGFVFFLFGYREKRSWLAFIIINLITQTFLNAMITGPGIGSYWIYAYVFLEIFVFIAEMIAFANIVRERSKLINALYAFAANLASLVLGGIIITYLPV